MGGMEVGGEETSRAGEDVLGGQTGRKEWSSAPSDPEFCVGPSGASSGAATESRGAAKESSSPTAWLLSIPGGREWKSSSPEKTAADWNALDAMAAILVSRQSYSLSRLEQLKIRLPNSLVV